MIGIIASSGKGGLPPLPDMSDAVLIVSFRKVIDMYNDACFRGVGNGEIGVGFDANGNADLSSCANGDNIQNWCNQSPSTGVSVFIGTNTGAKLSVTYREVRYED